MVFGFMEGIMNLLSIIRFMEIFLNQFHDQVFWVAVSKKIILQQCDNK